MIGKWLWNDMEKIWNDMEIYGLLYELSMNVQKGTLFVSRGNTLDKAEITRCYMQVRIYTILVQS